MLCIHSPARWLLLTVEQVGQEAVPRSRTTPIPPRCTFADMLRLFAGGGDGLLLDEGPAPVGELIDPEAYCPVLNIAGHYE